MNRKKPKYAVLGGKKIRMCEAEGCKMPHFAGGFCRWSSHQDMRTDPDWLRKKAMQADKPPKLYKIPKQSKKTASEEAKYNRRVKVWKKEPGNTICAVPGCGRPTDDCHHSRLRGIYLLDESTWIPLCRPHHDQVKMDRTWAESLNLIFKRTISEKKHG